MLAARTSRRYPPLPEASWIERLARRGFHAKLQQLRDGRIDVHEAGHVDSFGSEDCEDSLRATLSVHDPSTYRRLSGF